MYDHITTVITTIFFPLKVVTAQLSAATQHHSFTDTDEQLNLLQTHKPDTDPDSHSVRPHDLSLYLQRVRVSPSY